MNSPVNQRTFVPVTQESQSVGCKRYVDSAELRGAKADSAYRDGNHQCAWRIMAKSACESGTIDRIQQSYKHLNESGRK